MTWKLTWRLLSAGLVFALPAAALAAAPPECSPADMAGLIDAANAVYYEAGDPEGNVGRAFARLNVSHEGHDDSLFGVITRSDIAYPVDSGEAHDFALRFVVGVDGRVTCVALAPQNRAGAQPQWTPQRRAWAESVSAWRFSPYLNGGKPMPVIGDVGVREHALPQDVHALSVYSKAPLTTAETNPSAVPSGHLLPAAEGFYQPGPHRFPEYHDDDRSGDKGD